jgi:hypothetical protein
LMECEKSKVCNPLRQEWVASFELERILPFMVSQHSNMSNNNHKKQDMIQKIKTQIFCTRHTTYTC